jgi:predicted dinucleotide-binding enzyme
MPGAPLPAGSILRDVRGWKYVAEDWITPQKSLRSRRLISLRDRRAKAAKFHGSLFAVPYEALPQLRRDLKDEIRGKVVLDACNASSRTDSALAHEVQANGAGLTSAKLLPHTQLVRAFSAVDATQVEASFKHEREKLGVPLAGDDADAVQVAAQLVRDAGCEPVIVGNLAACESFDRNGPGWRANTTAPNLRQLLGVGDRK